MTRPRLPLVFCGLVLAALLAFALDLFSGSVSIAAIDFWKALTGPAGAAGSAASIAMDFRLPRAVASLFAGAALGVAGFLLQTQFRNPLAGPAELGISSGAGLGVALLLLAEPWFPPELLQALGPWPLAGAAALGAGATLALVLVLSTRLWDATTLLLAGLMIASAVGAVISVLQYFSEAAQLKAYALWGFGGLGGVTWEQNGVLVACVTLGLGGAALLSRPLYALLLGEDSAEALGIPARRFRVFNLGIASVLAGAVTAFCGPIAFVGLAVPHLARAALRRSDPRVLQPACMLLGAALLLVCDSLSHFPGQNAVLPINAVTSLFGAPTVLFLLLRRSSKSRSRSAA